MKNDIMKNNPRIHHRRSIRLKGYDYSKVGAYFITICSRNRECLFGEIDNEEMVLNPSGRIIESVWMELPARFPGSGDQKPYPGDHQDRPYRDIARNGGAYGSGF